MNLRKIKYICHSGKNSKLLYYIKSYYKLYTPATLLRIRCKHILNGASKRDDIEYIKKRVDYYNRLSTNNNANTDVNEWTKHAIMLKHQKTTSQSVYFLDAMTMARYFPSNLQWRLLPGDITYVPTIPSIVKSRPIDDDNANSVLLKLDKVRHFIFVNDKTPFAQKEDKVFFRGKVKRLENRVSFMNMFFTNPRFNCGSIDKDVKEWVTEKTTISEHLKYRYIMSLEGNDVASNLKWIMSSNSIAVTPPLKYESWFMEGTLIPNYHYIEVKPDYSDLEEKINYYSSHLDEAEAIIQHAHQFVAQFKNKKREKIISLLVLKKYFELTNKDKIA